MKKFTSQKANRIEDMTGSFARRIVPYRIVPYRIDPYRTRPNIKSGFAPSIASVGEGYGTTHSNADRNEVRTLCCTQDFSALQLQMISDATPAMIAYVDSDQRYRFVNHNYCEYFNCTRSALIGQTVAELLGEENYRAVAPYLARALAGERVNYEYPLRHFETRKVRVKDVTYVPDRDFAGNVWGCYVFITDVTDRRLQNMELADREQRHAALITSTAEGIFGMDDEGRCTFVNSACVRLLGYSHEKQLLGKSLHELIHQSHGDGTTYRAEECAIHQAVRQCRKLHVEKEVFWRADGTAFDVEFWSYPQYREGEVNGCVVTFLDVTERRRWERDLECREAHLRRVIENILGFVGVLETDGTLREVNKPAIEAAGGDRAELIGKKFWDCFWWNYDRDVQQQLQEAIRLAAAGDVQRYDAIIRLADGRRITIDFMLAPVRDAQGTVTHLIPSGVDISDRIQAESDYRKTARAVRDNEERLAMALRAGGMAAWEWNPSESIWTEELYQLLGVSSAEIASPNTLFKQVHQEDLPRLQAAWQAALDRGVSFEHEFRILRPDGQVRWLNWLGKVVCNEEGSVVRIFGLSWDSTQGHLAAEALRESERCAQEANFSKSQFIANMSHEIRTPMTAVLGYTDLLAAQESDPTKVEHLRTIKRNGSFLLEIINDILDLSKIEAGKMEIDRQAFSPHRLFADVFSMMAVRARACQLNFELKYLNKIPAKIYSDPKRLKQMLVNLVGNAIKFTEKGSVKLQVCFEPTPEPLLRFDVVDTGIGMTEEQKQNLFQPFSQGDASVTRKFGGTGLGLAISRRLAKMLGGDITFQSKHGQGSVFSCTILSCNADSVELITPNIQPENHELANVPSDLRLNCHVLVVDDRRDVRFLTKHFLVKAGAKVQLAEDGQQAVDLIKQSTQDERKRIDLVLLDMQMPRLDGYETARALRDMGFKQPIIALTADAMHGDMTRCIECGCDSYLSKPIDGPALLRAVAKHVCKS